MRLPGAGTRLLSPLLCVLSGDSSGLLFPSGPPPGSFKAQLLQPPSGFLFLFWVLDPESHLPRFSLWGLEKSVCVICHLGDLRDQMGELRRWGGQSWGLTSIPLQSTD